MTYRDVTRITLTWPVAAGTTRHHPHDIPGCDPHTTAWLGPSEPERPLSPKRPEADRLAPAEGAGVCLDQTLNHIEVKRLMHVPVGDALLFDGSARRHEH